MTLIIPIFNGAQYISSTCKELSDFCTNENDIDHVIFVNDGSTDRTKEMLENIKKEYSFSHRVLSYKENKGKGYAIKHALDHTKTDYVGFTDVELPYGLEKIKEGVLRLDTCDMVVGSRESGVQYSTYRSFMKKLFRLLLPRQIRTIRDTQCGFKLFKKDSAHVLFSKLKTYRWVFDIELFLIAQKENYTVQELPLMIKKECLTPKGGVSFLRDGLHIFLDLIRVRKCYKL
mgnify:CR=1 FL=1